MDEKNLPSYFASERYNKKLLAKIKMQKWIYCTSQTAL